MTGFLAESSRSYLNMLGPKHHIINFGSNMRFVDAQREQQIPEFDVEVGPDLEELQTRLYQHVLTLVG